MDKDRIWLDGCFDLFHYGHSNGIRQAHKHGKTIVGVHTDEEITQEKNIPVTNLSERVAAVRGCRWVNEVVVGSPYVTDTKLVDSYNCGIVMHGNDIVMTHNSIDTYFEAKKLGRFKEFERTLGISTTELVGRTIMRANCKKTPKSDYFEYQENLVKIYETYLGGLKGNVVYCDGVFDLFHAGHVELFKEAKLRGDSVAIGLFSDDEAFKLYGRYPIMSYYERLLGILACKYVDFVLEAKSNPKLDFLNNLNVKTILHTKTTDIESYSNCENSIKIEKCEPLFSYLSEKSIVERVFDNYNEYYKKIVKKLNK